MVAWVVNDRLYPRRTPPCCFPCPIPILELTPRSSLKKSPLSFHALMWSSFCNPFAFKFMHVMGGVRVCVGTRFLFVATTTYCERVVGRAQFVATTCSCYTDSYTPHYMHEFENKGFAK